MPIPLIVQAAPGLFEGAELVDQTAYNSEELSDIGLNKKSQKKAEDITFLEGALSWAAVGFSTFSLALFGEKLPMYENSSAGKWIKEKLSVVQKPKPLRYFHDFTKNLANGVLALANIGLLIINGSSMPLFSGTITSNFIKAAGKSFKEKWKALEENKYIGLGFKGVAAAINQFHIIINSKTTRNILGFSLGVLVAGTGPAGLALVTVAVATDIAKGAYNLHKTNALQDELNHLRSLKASIDKMGPEEAKKLSLGQVANPHIARSELHSALKESSLPAIVGQGALFVGAALNPAYAPMMLGEAVSTGVAILANKFTEESARSIMEAEIAELRRETGSNQSKHNLAQIAFAAAITAGSKKSDLEKDPLFSDDKIIKPEGFRRGTSALKTCIYSIGNYINPFKEPTSYVTFVVNDIEQKQVAAKIALQKSRQNYSSPPLSPPPTPINPKQTNSAARGA